jgi:hypothetical protein
LENNVFHCKRALILNKKFYYQSLFLYKVSHLRRLEYNRGSEFIRQQRIVTISVTIFNTLAVSRRYFQPKIHRFSAKKSKALPVQQLFIKNSFLNKRVWANRSVVKMRAFCITILLKVSFF